MAGEVVVTCVAFERETAIHDAYAGISEALGRALGRPKEVWTREGGHPQTLRGFASSRCAPASGRVLVAAFGRAHESRVIAVQRGTGRHAHRRSDAHTGPRAAKAS